MRKQRSSGAGPSRRAPEWQHHDSNTPSASRPHPSHLSHSHSKQYEGINASLWPSPHLWLHPELGGPRMHVKGNSGVHIQIHVLQPPTLAITHWPLLWLKGAHTLVIWSILWSMGQGNTSLETHCEPITAGSSGAGICCPEGGTWAPGFGRQKQPWPL